MRNSFLSLVRLGIGCKEECISHKIKDWETIGAFAEQQGLLAVMVDGIVKLPLEQRPPKVLLLQWIGLVMLEEERYAMQRKTSIEMASLLASNGIRTYILKGMAVSECYPKPQHRVSSDVDCFLLPDKGDEDVWEKGNRLMEEAGYKVGRGFYKNSSFALLGLTVESHRFMVPFRGNNRLRQLEIVLQGMLKSDKGEDRFEDTWLYRPPVMVSALFLIEHAYSHFLHEGLTWRHVLDWMMFCGKHKSEIDLKALDSLIDKYGFRKFYESYNKLGQYMLGDIDETSLTNLDKRMLKDVWSDLTLPASGSGLKNKFSIARNTLRARWKYHYFAEISMLQALLIQIKGFFFIKNPTLN